MKNRLANGIFRLESALSILGYLESKPLSGTVPRNFRYRSLSFYRFPRRMLRYRWKFNSKITVARLRRDASNREEFWNLYRSPGRRWFLHGDAGSRGWKYGPLSANKSWNKNRRALPSCRSNPSLYDGPASGRSLVPVPVSRTDALNPS